VLAAAFLLRVKQQMAKKGSQFKKIIEIAKDKKWQLGVIFGLVLLGSLYLTLLKALLWWDVLPLISYIQFPWRWLSMAILFLALLAGLGVSQISDERLGKGVAFCLIALMLLNVPFFQPEGYLERNEDFYYEDQELIRREMSGILPDYIPRNLKLEILKSDSDSNQETYLPIHITGAIIFNQEAFISIEEVVNRTHQKLVKIESAGDQELVFAVANYPGWKAEINGQPVEVKENGSGLIVVDVPAGQHQVGIWFGSTPARAVSDAVSALFVLGALALSVSPINTKS